GGRPRSVPLRCSASSPAIIGAPFAASATTMPDPLQPLLFALLGAGAGVLIGCVGIGGVIIVPALVYLFGVPIHVAIAAAMFAFLLSGLVGTAEFARRRSIRWSMTGWMWAG